jgi:Protein of unknown function (DUF2510)
MSNPAGWYPQEDGRQRYWDGGLWTEHFAPGGSPTPGQAVDATASQSPRGCRRPGAPRTNNVGRQMRNIVVRCLIFAGLVVAVAGFWVFAGGDAANSEAVALDSANSTVELAHQLGAPLSSSDAASIADAAALHQHAQVLTVVGIGVLVVGGGSLIFGFVLGVRRPRAKTTASKQALAQPPPTAAPPGPAGRQPCPQCGESISVLARVCRFCQHELDPGSVQSP